MCFSHHKRQFRGTYILHFMYVYIYIYIYIYRMTQKKRELLKNPTKIEEIQEKNLLTEIEPVQLAF